MRHGTVSLSTTRSPALVASVLEGCAFAARSQTRVAIRTPGEGTCGEPVAMHDMARKLYVYAAMTPGQTDLRIARMLAFNPAPPRPTRTRQSAAFGWT